MKTAISIPDELFEAAERLAKRLGLSRSELYQRAVAGLLTQHDEAAITAALNAVYDDTTESSRLDPDLEAAQFASLDEDDW